MHEGNVRPVQVVRHDEYYIGFVLSPGRLIGFALSRDRTNRKPTFELALRPLLSR